MPIFNRIFKARDKPKNSLPGNTYSFFFGSTTSGKTVNERTALQASRKPVRSSREPASRGWSVKA